MFWGITPSLDLLEEINITRSEEINVLLIGSSDIRHILKTVSRRYRKKPIRINFYIMELIPEVMAKQLLLLNIATRPLKESGLVQKTRVFMDIFGNTMIRLVSAKQLNNYARELIKMITNLQYLRDIMPFVKIELKYKQRDYIENVFKFWAADDEFDICESWDRRLRKFLGTRYDTRTGAFDWDLHMRFYHIGGQQICVQEYQSFRRNGVAFTWLESEVAKSNRSMVTGIINNGGNYAHYGYLGDMQIGPFIAFGLSCEDKEFLKKTNHQNRYRSTDLTERNLREMFHELEFKSEYEHKKTSDLTLGSCTLQVSDMKVVDNSNITPRTYKPGTKCLQLDDVSINFIPIDNLNVWKHKEKFKNYFNIIYYGNSYLKYITSDVINHIASPNSLLIIEHQLFVVLHRDKELEEYWKSVLEKTEGIEKVDCGFDFKKDAYIKFVLN